MQAHAKHTPLNLFIYTDVAHREWRKIVKGNGERPHKLWTKMMLIDDFALVNRYSRSFDAWFLSWRF
jgi:hypothetical protein